MKLTAYQRSVLKAAERGGLRRSNGVRRYVYITDPTGSWRAENVRMPTCDKLFDAGLLKLLPRKEGEFGPTDVALTDAGRDALNGS
jgi:hypothetical protein